MLVFVDNLLIISTISTTKTTIKHMKFFGSVDNLKFTKLQKSQLLTTTRNFMIPLIVK